MLGIIFIFILAASSANIIKEMKENNKYYEFRIKKRSVSLTNQTAHSLSVFLVSFYFTKYFETWFLMILIAGYLTIHCSIVNLRYFIHNKDKKSLIELIKLFMIIIILSFLTYMIVRIVSDIFT